MKKSLIVLSMGLILVGNVYAANCVIDGDNISVKAAGIEFQCEITSGLLTQLVCESVDKDFQLGFIPRGDDDGQITLHRGTAYGERSFTKTRLALSVSRVVSCKVL